MTCLTPAGFWSAAKAVRAAALGAAFCAGAAGAAGAADPIFIQSAPIAAPSAPLPEGVRFLSGFELRAEHEGFGGFSGLLIEQDRLTAVSDRGRHLGLLVRRGESGAITGVLTATLGLLLDRRGRPLRGRAVDAEALAKGPEGLTWVAFEQRHRVVGAPALGEPRAALARQLRTDGFAANGGVEALAATKDGVLIAMLEEPIDGADPTLLTGYRLAGGRAATFWIERIDDYAPTGLDVGPDGALYLLERRFGLISGFRMRIRRFAPDKLDQPFWGAGETLLDLSEKAPIDNMEGIAIDQAADGTVVATLISDDNFHALQKTILLQFALPPLPPPAR